LRGLLELVMLPKVAGVESICRWSCQNGMVEQVELRAEAAAQAFANREPFFERRVQFIEAGRVRNVPAGDAVPPLAYALSGGRDNGFAGHEVGTMVSGDAIHLCAADG
jgi:hypothetical protein